MNYKYFLLIIGIILISNSLLATTIDETTLNILDKGDIVVEKGSSFCKDFTFNLKSDEFSETYFQLMLKNYIPISKGVIINIKVNDKNITEIIDKEIKEKNIIKLGKFDSIDNKLEICIENNFLPRLIIDSDSLIGTYYNSKITDEDFYQDAPSTAYVNTLIPITIHVRNSGYADTFIELKNASNLFIYNSNLENVSGETSFEGLLKAQSEIKIDYFVKTDSNNTFATPIANLKYTDVFNQEITKKIKQKIITISEKENALENHIDIQKIIVPKEEQTGHLIIINNSEKEVTDVYIKPYFNGEIIVSQEKINLIRPKDVVEIPFIIKTYKEGEHTLNFTINYLEGENVKNIGTQTISINSENPDSSENTAITILLIITVFLFIWIVKI
ncbi:hypothetical protein GW835_04170 [archaeon]|nr:hypothetical protein [archaeon]NCP79735.1 hypothetical protein [archaeon]NCP98369.1 hypothetical protein [archaeon]NCQ07501.1 hypothetical protein [archaeon]NCQ51292.1 hypothetical protein [archaeon]